MNYEILKLAKECDTTDSFDFVGDTILMEFCEAFYRAAFNAGLEAAATKSARMANGNSIAAAIRALEKRP